MARTTIIRCNFGRNHKIYKFANRTFARGRAGRSDDLCGDGDVGGKTESAGADKIQAGEHPQILPQKLYGQAGLRYGYQAVATMAVPTGTGQRQPLIRTENVCGARPSHNGKNGTGRV